MRKRFIVELELPEEASYTDALFYIGDAVATWRGSLRPDAADGDLWSEGDPMWYLDPDSVKVIRYTRRRLNK